ncbi:hypothetical protein GCM10023322_68340 [Rugosimonospora acidiphila]|uniref:Uncharacterized protein n=1 Tax=Rugosimonospora acidiphila TaxID=556531 RepID=A0ABP9SMG8_9ACTN
MPVTGAEPVGANDGLSRWFPARAGRVIRAAPGKDVAEVHDYHDQATPILAASLQRRMSGYRALAFVTKDKPLQVGSPR